MEQKPHWFEDHESSDRENFDDIRNALQRIEIKLNPIFESYSTATTLGKWLMGTAVFISILTGIVMSLKTIFFK